MTEHVFLELLAREAGAVEFEEPLLAARAAGADPGILARLERAKVEALKVRALLRRRARREAELSALYDSAGDLAGLRDLDDVLEAIVRRARRLLSTDTATLALRDPERGDTYVRVTDGSVSARFRSLRLAMGDGLGGLVAQAGTPYATPDYFADGGFLHTTDIDRAVREEGLVAILGVPLRLGGEVIGVLLAADRAPRPFAPEEVALLGSLAAHAAVAIDNARLLAETRTALTELEAANQRIRSQSAAVERAGVAHDRMAALVLRGGGVADVAAVVTQVLGGGLTVFDGGGVTLHGDEAWSPAVGQAAHEARSLGRAVRHSGLLVASVEVDGDPVCTLVLEGVDAEPGSGGVEPDDRLLILERAALVTALLLLSRRNVAEAEGRVRGELLDDLISRPGSAGLQERARRLRVDLCAPHLVIVARHDGSRERAAFWAASTATVAGGLATARDEEVILLLPAPQRATRTTYGTSPHTEGTLTAKRLAADLSASLGKPATAGASQIVHTPTDVAPAYREARRCADALLSLGRPGDGAAAADLGFVGLLMGEQRDVGGYIAGLLGPVIDYDRRRGTSLVNTLSAYFASGGSLTRTAETLHIHVNTVSQRLERITHLLGADWQTPTRSLELHVALHLHHLGPTDTPDT
ncbi:helix-turn-helix domain-containing protein [Sinosporangium siamense]|uniref:Cyclic diguanylate phosphodiesterase n=1 Tax=Sinosporangium siamense TaxID=1367973 RepID=A0A919RGG3_9ACTN|nr:helix-turn-helix domain-containing protein [Sinosporangium siamense]GII93173.1 cyclic diguanylate phosphodiesterase [Sinosporangium siamense]